MTKTNTSKFILRKLIFMWLLVLPVIYFAQNSGTYIKWNFQVGCAENASEYDPKNDNGVLFENIERSECIRVCEGSTVTYTVEGTNISNVQWNVSGGSLQSTSGAGNSIAIIQWGSVGTGAIQITITYSNGTTENRSLCIDKINSPRARFILAGNAEPRVCRNTPVYFTNLSEQNGGSDIVYYHWDFDDGTPPSSAFEPVHTFTDPGVYNVTLTVTNKCNCSHKYSMKVEVVKSEPVKISCPSVVCEGSVATYTADDNCGGDWEVIGGTIISNSGTSIQVKWDHVDPAEGFGYVLYRSHCNCPEWVTVKVPVVLGKVEIKGEQAICVGKQYKYALPQWPSTSLQWNISGPSGAQLTYNEHRNEVFLTAYTPGTYLLWCTYKNTVLGCEGRAELKINVDQPVQIQGGADQICSNSSLTFTSNPNTAVIWQVTKDNTVLYTSPTPATALSNYLFSSAGVYMITATKPGGCTGEPKIVKVVATPPAPSGNITGELKVCAGVPYVYTLSTIAPGTVPVWEVTNGSIQGSNSGQSVTVIFNVGATSFTVSVRNKSLDPLGCLSAPLTLAVQKAIPSAIITPASVGPYCPSSTMTFTADLGGIVADQMEWSFASPNFGSFVSGQGTNQIVVNFNEISNNIDTTNLRLKVVKCGQEFFFDYTVKLYKLPVVSFTNIQNICLGEANLSFTIDQGGITSATNVTFTFSNGSPPHIEPFNLSGNYSFINSGYIQNNTGANITQTVTVTINGAFNCTYKPTANANFIVYPETKITITPTANLEICDPNNYIPHTLYANISTGLTPSTVFEWRKNNVIIPGAASDSYTIQGNDPYGVYFVRVKDGNNCWVRSQSVTVIQKCADTSCFGVIEPIITVNANWTGCNTLAAQASYSATPDQVEWLSNSILTLLSGQGTNNAVFTTDVPGVHLVTVRLRFGNCWFSKTIEIKKHYQPKFNITQSCSSNGTFDVTLHNNSLIFDINQNNINFTFGGTGLPNQNGQTVTYSNLSPGTYTFTLTLASGGNYPCTVSETFVIDPAPNLSFTGLSPIVCKGETINLNVVGYNPANTYRWYFDGTSYVSPPGSGGGAEISLNNFGNKQVVLEVTTPQNCVYTSQPQNTFVNQEDFSGFITAMNTNICEGSGVVPVLTYQVNAGSLTPSSYIWMNGDQEVIGAPNISTFTPTGSGNYWPVLVGATGCKVYDLASQAVAVTVRPKPYVNISATANICAGQSTTLYGIVTDNTLQYQWLKNNSQVTAWANAPYPITLNTGNLAAGTYTYTLKVRPASDPGCESSKNFTITVSNPPSQIGVSYTILNCQPYEVQLTATGPSNGQYNWSNGMTGQTITVNHGGAYRVTYTAPSGCSVENDIQVPQSLESLMWIFPTGCFDVCPDGTSYIIGPRGLYDGHHWQLNNANIQSGTNDFIYPLLINQAGNYNLQITQGPCTLTSGTMNVNPNPEKCKLEPCKITVHIEGVRGNGIPNYIVYGAIYNYAASPVTLTITSSAGYGTYSPSTITIPAGGMYDMWANPLLFTPNSSFPGGTDGIVVQGYGCEVKEPIEFPKYGSKMSEGQQSIKTIQLTPNPAQHQVQVAFDTGNTEIKAKLLTIHDTSGTIKYRQELKSSSGKIDIDISQWLQGVYIVNVITTDKPLQAKLLKK